PARPGRGPSPAPAPARRRPGGPRPPAPGLGHGRRGGAGRVRADAARPGPLARRPASRSARRRPGLRPHHLPRPSQPAAAPPLARPNLLTPRPRPPAPAVKPVAVGSAVTTNAHGRRRVVLPDGSVLYLNENTRVRLAADRVLEMSRGEVFVEVSPRPQGERGA